MTRSIIHLDMDAFYASVEILDNPELRGLPVIVGGESNRGVVSAASYEARKSGIHSALPIAIARRRCPNGIFLPVRMYRYIEMSERIMDIFRNFTPLVEQISVDEAFLDVTGCDRLFGSNVEIATAIRARVKEETGLTVSAGVASSKLVAKIASDLNKPDGLTVVPAGEEKRFLAPLAISRLWGVGKKTLPTLNLLGVKTIGDLTGFPLEFLEKKFGKQGRHMYFCSRGIDQRDVEIVQVSKSIGNEETFSHDILDIHLLKKELLHLSTKIGERLRRKNFKAATITLKVRYHDFSTISRSLTLKQATDDSRQLYLSALDLLQKTMAGAKAVRLVGINVATLTGTDSPQQLNLFTCKQKKNRTKLNQAIDTINNRYGSLTIKPGLLSPPPPKNKL